MASPSRGLLVACLLLSLGAAAGSGTASPDASAASAHAVSPPDSPELGGRPPSAAVADRQTGSDAPNVTVTGRYDPPWDGTGELRIRISGTVSGHPVTSLSNATVIVEGRRSFTVPLRPTSDPDEARFAVEVTRQRRISTVEVRVESAVGGDVGADRLQFDGDGLSDTYEHRTVGTDPGDPDSDSSATGRDEADDGVVDGAEDFDRDGLNTYRERDAGTDPHAADTDGDDLGDAFEVHLGGTDPLLVDTDGDGTPDGEEFSDGDGLTAAEEQRHGTHPGRADTDDDGLTDDEELEMGTDPSLRDSDGDGIYDGRELDPPYETDPTARDTDGDGHPDGQRPYPVPLSDSSLEVTVQESWYGSDSGVEIADVDRPYLVNSGTRAAAVSRMVRLEVDASFEEAVVEFEYNPKAVGDPADVSVYRYDPERQTFLPLRSTVYLEEGVVRATVTQPGTYVAFDAATWSSLFAAPLPEPGREIEFDEEDVTCEGSGRCTVEDGAIVLGDPDRLPAEEPDEPASERRTTPTPTDVLNPWDPPTTVVGTADGSDDAGSTSDDGWFPGDWFDGIGDWLDAWWPG